MNIIAQDDIRVLLTCRDYYDAKPLAKRTFDGLLLGGRIRRLPCKLRDAASVIPASSGSAFSEVQGL